MLENPAYGLLLSPGLGKTAVTLAAFKVLRDRGIVRRALVLAPLRVCTDVWPEELAKWTDFHDLRMTVLHGPKKDQRLRENADIYVMNYEGLPWLAREGIKVWGTNDWPEMLVADESTRLKHPRTQRFKILRGGMLKRFKRRYILTGTPAPNGLMDLFGQLYVLDLGQRLGRYITHYRVRFFVESWDGFSWDLRPGAEEEIYKAISDAVLRLDALDHLDMPELVKTTIGVNLPAKARAVYEELKEEFVLKVKEGEVTAKNAAVLTSKLRQVANGAVYADEELLGHGRGAKKEVVSIHKAKLDALEDLVEELSGQPLLVAYEFEHDYRAINSRFKDVPRLGGGVTTKQASEIIKQWNAGELPILAVHPASAGYGLNLQAGGGHVAWYGLTWNLEHHDQLIDRLWRQGQRRKHVFVYYLVARGTMDTLVLSALEDKAASQRELFDAVKKEYVR